MDLLFLGGSRVWGLADVLFRVGLGLLFFWGWWGGERV